MKFTTTLSALLPFLFAGATAQTVHPREDMRELLAGCPPSGGPCPEIYDPVICGPKGCVYSNQCFATSAGFAAGKCSPCPAGDCPDGKNSSRHRLLTSNARSLKQEDAAYLSYLSVCGENEYDVSLYVDPETHLYVIGVPKNQYSASSSTSLGCPFGAAHAVMSDKAKASKEILVWKDANEGASMFEEEAQMHIGTFKLSDMAQAYEAADPFKNNGSSFYDVVTNNCGAFLVNLALELDVKIDPRITSFVARRLLENSGKQLASKVRNSLNYLSLFDHRNLRGYDATDEEIVRLLVKKGVSPND